MRLTGAIIRFVNSSFEVAGDRVDEVSEAFNTLGALSVTVLDAGDGHLNQVLNA